MSSPVLGLVIAALVVAALVTGLGIVLVTSQVPEITVKYVEGTLPLDPDAQLWNQLGKVNIPLAGQLLAYPTSSPDITPRELAVTAAYNATHLAIYIEWADATKNVAGAPGDISSFPDAVAVAFPVNPSSLPYICMGDIFNPVHIAYWRAGAGVESLVAGSAYGRKPEEREALGLQSKLTSPIELLPPEAQVWKFGAKYENGSWKVVLMRPLASVHPMIPEIKPGSSVSVAFANWEGSLHERGGSKSTSGWYMLALQPVTVTMPAAPRPEAVTVTVIEGGVPRALGSLVIILAAALAIAVLALVIFAARAGASKGR